MLLGRIKKDNCSQIPDIERTLSCVLHDSMRCTALELEGDVQLWILNQILKYVFLRRSTKEQLARVSHRGLWLKSSGTFFFVPHVAFEGLTASK